MADFPLFSRITVSIPYGYFMTYLHPIAALLAKFGGIKVAQGGSADIQILGDPSDALTQVRAWAELNLPAYSAKKLLC